MLGDAWIARVASVALCLVAACGDAPPDGGSDGCVVGDAGCPCTEDGACEGALVCMDGVCEPGAGASTTSAPPVTTSGTSSSATGSAGTDAGSTSTSAGTSACSEDGGGSRPDGTTGPCEFICENDEPSGEWLCDPFSQNCCEGHKCAAYDYDGDGAWDSTKCVPVTGDGQHGDPCAAEPITEGGDDCGPGVMCWHLDDEGAGACVELCTGTPEDPSCAPPYTECKIVSESPLILCLSGCDPLLQDCGDSQTCIDDPSSDRFVCVLDASGGMGPEGTPCEFANVCNPGLMCVNPNFYPNPDCEGSLGCCAPFCDLEEPDACAGLSVAEAECVPFYAPEPAPEDLENVGVCGAPG